MFAFASLLALASAYLPTVFAHGGVIAYSNAGNWYQGWYATICSLPKSFPLTHTMLGLLTTHPTARLPSNVLGLRSASGLVPDRCRSKITYLTSLATRSRTRPTLKLLAMTTAPRAPSNLLLPSRLVPVCSDRGTRSGLTQLARWYD